MTFTYGLPNNIKKKNNTQNIEYIIFLVLTLNKYRVEYQNTM